MNLQDNLVALATAIGTDINDLQKAVATLQATPSGGATISDGMPSTTAVWSSSFTMELLNSNSVALQQNIDNQANTLWDAVGDTSELFNGGETTLVEAVNAIAELGGATSPFTKEFVSGELTIAPNDMWILTHNLGVIPKLVMLTLICKVADSFGYEVGEEVSLDQVYTGISYEYNVGIQSSATSTKIRTKVATSGAGLTNINTGQPSIVNPDNYKLIVRAWA